MTDTNELRTPKQESLREKIEEILWDLLRMDWHINHMAEDLSESDTAEDRQKNIDETARDIEKLITARTKAAYKQGYIDGGIEQLTTMDKKT